MIELLTPALKCVPDLTINEIESALRQIYQQSDNLYFEYNIGKFLEPGWDKIKNEIFADKLTNILNRKDAQEFTNFIHQKSGECQAYQANPDRELYSLAAHLAEELQNLWGQLD